MYECWVWLVQEKDGTEGIIATWVPELSMISVLHAREKWVADHMERYARIHEAAVERPVRLVHLKESE